MSDSSGSNQSSITDSDEFLDTDSGVSSMSHHGDTFNQVVVLFAVDLKFINVWDNPSSHKQVMAFTDCTLKRQRFSSIPDESFLCEQRD